VIATHLKGTFNVVRHAAPHMKEQGWGRIVNITSSAGLRGNFGQTNYAAAKAGIMGMTFVWALELGKYGICVNAVAPAGVTRMTGSLADGSILLIDEKGPRIVADGFRFTNEIRLDAKEEWLYVAETTGKCVTRLRVQPDGSLTDRELYGPSSLGDGVVDGITFDVYGNLWATMIFADRLVAITPTGDVLELMNDGNPAATARFEQAFATGAPVPFDVSMQCGGPTCNWLASVTFGGLDLSTVYLGGLRSTAIPYFRSPVAGLPMVHW